MLTDRGWAAAGAGLALTALWAALGELELLITALLLFIGITVGLLYVRISRPRVSIVRQINPSLVYEGDQAVVEATITNEGRFRILNPTFEDEVGGLGSARFHASSIKANESVVANYQIVCRPRGIYTVGPAVLVLHDPFRFARRRSIVGGSDRLVVYPEVERLTGFPVVRGRDPAVHASRPEFSHRGGEDFYTIREYRTGDDLRRVHWPTSAKRDQLMIRQLETPWQSQALVMLDVRSSAYSSPAAFEKAVKGAASVTSHLFASGFETSVWTGAIALNPGESYAKMMETLAVVRPVSAFDVVAAASRLQKSGRGGALIMVTGRPDRDLLAAHRLLSRDYPSTIALTVASPDGGAFQQLGVVTLDVETDQSWAAAWLTASNPSWSTVSAG
ncbi:MAG: DUF58 domain-containing protein [Acidimicrobiia bacterium]|nr:DUF58 domain-containing protein [Acidimicrobiia bacterium]MDH5421356.1 DUF58 domain-containing protein [Acidimicrobiia bacterium]